MILSAASKEKLEEALDKIGLKAALRQDNSVLIKINLARPPDPGHPRTDPLLLANVVRYVVGSGASCAIAEGANGFFQENLECIGLAQVVLVLSNIDTEFILKHQSFEYTSPITSELSPPGLVCLEWNGVHINTKY